MTEAPPTFSESWYRIADQRISLRPGVRVVRQLFRGEQWHVLQNPFNNQFFRLHPAAYAFVARLKPGCTVQQAWEECLAKDPGSAPGQEEVLRLISQLYYANLLQYDAPADSARLFERYKKRKEKETASKWLNIMFLRIPLLDPDAWMDRIRPLVNFAFHPVMALAWLLVTGLGIKACVDNFDALKQQSQGVLEPGNLFLLYVGLVIIKTLHEFGHAFACKKHGGEVHVMGVMLLIFTPTPYMDATSSWGFRNRWHRILVGAAGMIVEVFFAAVAALVWAKTGPGTVHSLAYNMIFVASISTIIFNANPLLRYDGYYMLSDWLEIPNLYQRAGQQLKFWMERYLFGVKKAVESARGKREAAWLGSYAILSGIYRIIVFGGILLFVADRFLILGILMALVCAISWVLVPTGRFIKYLATSPQLERNRPRAVAVSACFVLGLLAFLQFVPFPSHFRAPGILEAQEKTDEVNLAPGVVVKLLAAPGASVTNGQPLLLLQNRELELQNVAALARLEETQAMWRQAMQSNVANLKPIEQRLELVQKQLKRLESDLNSLTVRAGQDGVWISPEAKDFIGRWLPRGSNLGLVVNPRSFIFTATVTQTEGNRLFSRQIHGAAARVKGQAGVELKLGELKTIQAAQRTLPSAALGWQAGGEMPVSMNDSKGRTATEPFFEVKAAVLPQDAVVLVHGRSGKMRFDLDAEPLMRQWLRKLHQMLQKRYQLT